MEIKEISSKIRRVNSTLRLTIPQPIAQSLNLSEGDDVKYKILEVKQ